MQHDIQHSIEVSVKFSYQGKDYAPSLQVNLEQLLEKSSQLPSFYLLIAQANNIDTYSYLYEVMEQSHIIFTKPQGLASDFTHDNQFNSEDFCCAFAQLKLENKLQHIVNTEMAGLKYGVDLDLTENKPLKNALLKAYQLGINKIQ